MANAIGAPRFGVRLDLAKAIPSPGPTLELGGDCLIYSLLIMNPTGTTATISVSDGQPDPIYLIPPDQLPPNAWVVFSDANGYLLPGGFQWSSSSAGLHGRALLVSL